MTPFIERRKEYRLPFEDKIVFTDGQTAFTGYALNISRGGLFVTCLNPFPIDTKGHIAFFLPGRETTLCFKAKVVHLVFDKQRCEVENGMGFMFMDLSQEQRDLLDAHVRNDQECYLSLKRILAVEQPNPTEIAKHLKQLPTLKKHDLLGLRYRVNRICTILEAVSERAAA